jgi:hypothetical protein
LNNSRRNSAEGGRNEREVMGAHKYTIRWSFIIFFFFLSSRILAQGTNNKKDWHDTTFVFVNLQETITDRKIVVIEIGQKAIIYLKEKLLRKYAVQNSNDFNEYSKIIHLLDSVSGSNDTITIDQYLPHFDYLVAEQLENGNAKVFYKKIKSFVPQISHRLEKYGMYAHRFFYLPDKRPFFSTIEFSGIIEDDKIFSDKMELEELAEKLASIRME